MLAQFVAVITGVFVFSDLKSRCFTRHAALCAIIPVAFSLWTELLAAAGVRIDISLHLVVVSLDLLALAAAGGGIVVARKLGDRFAEKYLSYLESLT
ncbi:MAG: hypothetical protein WBV82_17645 [Myxococcaceae bacterium]